MASPAAANSPEPENANPKKTGWLPALGALAGMAIGSLAFTFPGEPTEHHSSNGALSSREGPRRTILVGGGAYPDDAMAQFMEWAGGPGAKILVVSWAGSDPEGSYDRLSRTLAKYQPGALVAAPTLDAMIADPSARKAFIDQLSTSDGVFFTGGDQNRIFEVLKHAEVRHGLLETHRSGVVFGGSSAGTAMMSEDALTGEGSKTVRGLGTLTTATVDQHFLKRDRLRRLLGALGARQKVGLGIDEDGAISVEDGKVNVLSDRPLTYIGMPDARGNRPEPFLLERGAAFELPRERTVPQRGAGFSLLDWKMGTFFQMD